MARIYSWQLTNTKYAYITGIEDDTPFVSNRLNPDDYDIVINKVDAMTENDYSSNFQKLCILCEQYGVDPTKEGTITYASYYDTQSLGKEFMVVLAGKNGKDGAKGEKGEKGDPGEPGAKADTPVPYISVTAYCSTGDSPVRPTPPTNVTVTWDADTQTYNFTDSDGDWYLSDSDANDNDGDGSEKSIIWQSSAIYNDRGIVNAWSKPIRITGENGEPGADGNNLEFIYRLWESPLPPSKPTSVNENKYVPKNEGWTGSPTGISQDYPYEYMCQRDRDENGDWREWEGPIIWAKWGQDGKDGDGVEYCYYTTNGTKPSFRCDDEIESENYQKNEYRPYAQLPTGPEDAYEDVTEEGREYWFDNPQEINSDTHRAQWMIVRKRRTDDVNKKAMWGEFSEPTLWSMYGEKGDRGVEGLNVYERRAYQAITGDSAPIYNREEFDPGSMWSTSVPVKGEGESIWCIEAYIKLNLETKKQELCWYDGTTEVINGDVPHWSVPYIIEGKDGKDASHLKEEIFKSYAEGETPELPTENEKDKDFFCPEHEGWNMYPIDMSEETPVCYMCYRERELKELWGSWGDWQGPFLYSKLGQQGPAGLDGKNGLDGKDGKSIEYIYCLTFDDTKPNHFSPANEIAQGVVNQDDYLPFVNDTDIRWTDEPQGVDEGNPYEWVKSRVKTYDPINEVMVWSKFSEAAIYAKWGFNGKDGENIEYIYCLTKTYEKPGIVAYDNTSEEAQSADFCPEISFSGSTSDVSGNFVDGKMYWVDNAVDVTLEWPYQWEVIRKRIATPNADNPNLYDNIWEVYDSNKVTLHSKWGRDGDQGRQGVAGVAGIHYEMRFIPAKQDDEDNIILSMPKINDDGTDFDGYVDIILDSDEWTEYWENTNYPNSETPMCEYRNLSKVYFPLYTDIRPVTQEYPYMFFIQSRITEQRTEIKEYNPNNGMEEIVGYENVEILEPRDGAEVGTWEKPARLTGKQGIQGPEGKNGPILYSAGVYGMGKKYYTDGVKKPYVLDPADKEYYYLNKGNYTAGSMGDDKGMDFWYMDEDGETGSMGKNPSSSVKNEQDYWVKMEQFDVILANVGIFNSALVGSGVFYGEWFYSQSGTINGQTSTEYEKFLDVKTSYDDNGNIEITYPEGVFKPNMAFNLKDGSGWLANGNISWDANGKIQFGSNIEGLSNITEFQNVQTNINNLSYLSNAFKDGKTIINGGLIMSELVAVTDGQDTHIEAFLNGSSKFKDEENNHGKILIAAGIPKPYDNKKLEELTKESNTILYEDGTLKTKKAELLHGCKFGDNLSINVDEWYGYEIKGTKTYDETEQHGIIIRGDHFEMEGGYTSRNGEEFLRSNVKINPYPYVDAYDMTGYVEISCYKQEREEYLKQYGRSNPTGLSLINANLSIDEYCVGDIPQSTSYDKPNFTVDRCRVLTENCDTKESCAAAIRNHGSDGVDNFNYIGLEVSGRDTAIKATKGVFEGLRPKVLYIINEDGEVTYLDEFVHTVIVNRSENKNHAVILPENPLDGQEYVFYICHPTSVFTIIPRVKGGYRFNGDYGNFKAGQGLNWSYEKVRIECVFHEQWWVSWRGL